MSAKYFRKEPIFSGTGLKSHEKPNGLRLSGPLDFARSYPVTIPDTWRVCRGTGGFYSSYGIGTREGVQ